MLVLGKLLSYGGRRPPMAQMRLELSISSSEVHAALKRLERFPIVRSTAVMVLLSPGGTHGAVFDGFAHARGG